VIAALVPAAGHSRRMGAPKLALEVAGRSVIEHVVEALRAAGAAPVLVVLAPHVAFLGELAARAGAEVLRLPEATPDMRATVEAGLGWLEERCRPGESDAWLLAPADHPALDAGVVRRLIEARQQRPDRSIFVPTWRGRRGHPALIGWGHVAGIRARPRGEGLNVYFRARADAVCEVPVESAAVVEDLDTPEDFARLLGPK
jgi:molybdenum cofactor cytidylyltransferase